jgi:hypothetical protein
MAQYRQLVDAGGISEDDEGDYWGGFFQACKDPFTWLFAGMHFSIIIGQSFKDFFPSVSSKAFFNQPMKTNQFSDCEHTWIQQNYHVSHPSTTIYCSLFYHTASVMVIRQTSGTLLAHCWLHASMSDRGCHHDFYVQRPGTVLLHVPALHWAFHQSECRWL